MGVEPPVSKPVAERRTVPSEMPETRPMTMRDEMVQLNRETRVEPKWYEVERKTGNKGKKTKKAERHYEHAALQTQENEARKRRRY
jgi:hypothetical protein